MLQETMNFWKQSTHILSYFKGENFRGDKRLPSNFMEGFLEVSLPQPERDRQHPVTNLYFCRDATK